MIVFRREREMTFVDETLKPLPYLFWVNIYGSLAGLNCRFGNCLCNCRCNLKIKYLRHYKLWIQVRRRDKTCKSLCCRFNHGKVHISGSRIKNAAEKSRIHKGYIYPIMKIARSE